MKRMLSACLCALVLFLVGCGGQPEASAPSWTEESVGTEETAYSYNGLPGAPVPDFLPGLIRFNDRALGEHTDFTQAEDIARVLEILGRLEIYRREPSLDAFQEEFGSVYQLLVFEGAGDAQPSYIVGLNPFSLTISDSVSGPYATENEDAICKELLEEVLRVNPSPVPKDTASAE